MGGAAHIMDMLYSSETACVTGLNYGLTEQDYIKIANLEYAAGVKPCYLAWTRLFLGPRK